MGQKFDKIRLFISRNYTLVSQIPDYLNTPSYFIFQLFQDFQLRSSSLQMDKKLNIILRKVEQNHTTGKRGSPTKIKLPDFHSLQIVPIEKDENALFQVFYQLYF